MFSLLWRRRNTELNSPSKMAEVTTIQHKRIRFSKVNIFLRCCLHYDIVFEISTSLDIYNETLGVHGRSWGPETLSICFLTVTVAECPSYTAVHRRWSGLPCCCCPHLEQSAPTCYVCTLYVCFPRSPLGFPLQAFLPMTFIASVTAVIFGHLNHFYLLSYLHSQKYSN